MQEINNSIKNGKLTISKLEEQWENYKMSFQMSDVVEVCKGYKKFSLHIVFVTFSFMGSLARQQNMMFQCLIKYGIQPADT